MTRRPLIPVEPLSERRWQEVRRAVLDRARELPPAAEAAPSISDEAPTWRRRAAPVLALVAIAAAILLAFTHGSTPRVAGTSRVVTDGAAATASAGDVTLELAAHTSVLVVELGPEQWLVSIEHGSVRFSVPPRGERPSFSVEAGRTRVVVIGTTFRVSREPGAASGEVQVEHGTVRVEDLAEHHVLHDGERWPTLPAVEPSRDEHTLAAAGSSPEPVVAPPPTTTRVARHVVVAPPADVSAEPTPDEAPAAPTDTVSTADTPATTPVASDGERYHQAEALEAREPARALEIYAALVGEAGAWSAPALMAEARLEYEQHHHAQARALCERYLAEHPDGINAEDARDLLARMR